MVNGRGRSRPVGPALEKRATIIATGLRRRRAVWQSVCTRVRVLSTRYSLYVYFYVVTCVRITRLLAHNLAWLLA